MLAGSDFILTQPVEYALAMVPATAETFWRYGEWRDPPGISNRPN